MTDLLSNYLPIVLFVGLAGVIGLALLVAPFLIAVKKPDPEKVSAYECGFDAFDDFPDFSSDPPPEAKPRGRPQGGRSLTGRGLGALA